MLAQRLRGPLARTHHRVPIGPDVGGNAVLDVLLCSHPRVLSFFPPPGQSHPVVTPSGSAWRAALAVTLVLKTRHRPEWMTPATRGFVADVRPLGGCERFGEAAVPHGRRCDNPPDERGPNLCLLRRAPWRPRPGLLSLPASRGPAGGAAVPRRRRPGREAGPRCRGPGDGDAAAGRAAASGRPSGGGRAGPPPGPGSSHPVRGDLGARPPHVHG